MTIRALQESSRKTRDAAGRAYIAQRTGQYRRIVARETDAEIRAAVRELCEVQS